MLRSLTIRDFVIVDHVTIEFGAGFTVLTGETGAGKSILIDALSLVLGGRGDDAAVRSGAKQAEVSAEFDVGELEAVDAWLADAGLEGDPGTCLVRRIVEAGARSRAFINGHAVTVAQLRTLGELLVDIHGQHAHQSLLRGSAQRELLDAYAGADELAVQVSDAHRRLSDIASHLEEATRDAVRLVEEREQLQSRLTELDRLGFQPNEWSDLNSEHARLANASSLIQAVTECIEALADAEPSAAELLAAAIARLGRVAEYDVTLRPMLDMIDSARVQVNEARHELERYRLKLDADPRRLTMIEARIAAVHEICRKYRTSPDALPEFIERTRIRLSALDDDLDVARLERERDAARHAFDRLAEDLSRVRKKAASTLKREVTAAIQQLALAGGRFEAVLEPLAEPAAHGAERVEFRIAAHAGLEPGPLGKVASGGELSRVSLAIQAALSQVARVPTLIFDEVDAGIGGRVAEIVGRMLAKLATRHQVMCITHLPQVAVCADHHLQVAKSESAKQVVTSVASIEGTARVEEIARMLGGLKITNATLAHAAEMLQRAARPKA
jgi:DNA repair protein RecN (Recombination protein N)